MKINSRIIPLIGVATLGLPIVASEPRLPKVEILGKEYYYHEIKKGESIYGIAKNYGWDLNELVRLNPNTASEMEKGSRLYYPTGKETVVTTPTDTIADEEIEYEPIRHVVKKGETVYSISRQYNIPLETIYAAYPNAKYGIKAGETLEIQQSPETVSGKYLYYVIKPGDTLYSLANQYKTTIEDILRANPGVSERNFRIGDTVRLAVNSGSKRIHTELVEEERLASIDSYKVKKNDTWNTISKKTGVDVETLKESNEEVSLPKKNEVINVPVVETVQVEKEIEGGGSAEMTSEHIQEVYDSIHNVDSAASMLAEVKVAMLLDEPSSKKDIEFSRGFLLALNEMKNESYKINLKIIDGRAATSAVVDQLDYFEPNLIVATADKAFPAFLADYGNTNNIEVVNVFDVKNELYEDNSSMVQMLPPSTFFNEQVADHIADDYSGWELLFVGVEDSNDGIAELIMSKFPEYNVKKLSVSSLSEFNVSDDGRYLIYAYPQKREEVADVMQAVANIRENSPFAEVAVVGRPNWVTLTDVLGDKFSEAGVVVPSRLWFDMDSNEGKLFVKDFTDMYGGAPVKSFPNFAVSGYDVAHYFIPSTANNGGDFNNGFTGSTKSLLQSEIKLKRVNNWGGFINPMGYLLKFRPGGYVDKVLMKW